MFRFFALILIVFLCSAGYAQVAAQVHEPTSATDGGVKLHHTKKSRFTRTTKARKNERLGNPVKDSKYKADVRPTESYVKDSKVRAQARGTERHGKSFRKSRGGRKLNGESRVYRRHGSSATSSAERKNKVKRSLGWSSQ